jgi:hypothetical protein
LLSKVMSRLREIPDKVFGLKDKGVAGVLTHFSNRGKLLIAEGVLSDGRRKGKGHGFTNGTGGFRTAGNEGLSAPERPATGPFDFVLMTDFGGDSRQTDLANGEVELNLRSLAKKHNVEAGAVTQVPLEGFSTANTGFATAQLALYKDHGDIDRVFYINTNPRLDPDDKRSWTDEDNFGRFVYIRLKNGTRIFTVNSKYALSFVKDEIDEGYVLKTSRNHQFLSRREFILPIMAVLGGDTSYFEGELNIAAIPDPPEGDLVAKDGNGNIKTSWQIGHLLKHKDIADSPYLTVSIGDETHTAKNDLIPGRHHQINTGDLVVRGGSSGYPDWLPPTEGQYVEVQEMFGSAMGIFNLDRVRDNTRVDIAAKEETVFERSAA